MVQVALYPNLSLLCWNRMQDFIDEAEALALYERNWRLVDVNGISDRERALIDSLVRSHGNGVLLV